MILLRRHVTSSKTDPLVDEVELLQANPNYAYIRYPDGKEDTVATKHLAPPGSEPFVQFNNEQGFLPSDPIRQPVPGESENSPQPTCDDTSNMTLRDGPVPEATATTPYQHGSSDETPTLRISNRTRRPPTRFEA